MCKKRENSRCTCGIWDVLMDHSFMQMSDKPSTKNLQQERNQNKFEKEPKDKNPASFDRSLFTITFSEDNRVWLLSG